MLLHYFTSLDRDEAEKLMETKDLDTDGRLSYEEFMGESSKAEKLFRLMDKDGDGYVTKNVRENWLFITKYQSYILLKLICILFFQEFKEVCKNLSKDQVENEELNNLIHFFSLSFLPKYQMVVNIEYKLYFMYKAATISPFWIIKRI